MVRLKVVCARSVRTNYNLFQFQNGAIKRQIICERYEVDEHFNSKMVRLKEIRNRDVSPVAQPFQFQNGAIKRSKSVLRSRRP